MSTTLTRADSVEEQDPHNARDDKKQKSRRPANTAFRQQRLKAWQPILTPKSVLPMFFIIGIIFAPIGGLLIWTSSKVEELVIDYSKCSTEAPEGQKNSAEMPKDQNLVKSAFKSTKKVSYPSWYREEKNVSYGLKDQYQVKTTVCSLIFELPNDLGPSVFFYYRLEDFYQNHRRYVKSVDVEQLKGKAQTNNTVSGGTCDPLRIDPDTKKAYFPCGLIANSWFNDTFSSPRKIGVRNDDNTNETYPMTNKGISWASDRSLYKTTKYTWDQVSPPRNWEDRYPKGYEKDNPPPDLREWEEFQVWMRTAGLPRFSKLALRNDNQTMTAGTYQVDIHDYFPVHKYNGKKYVVFTTTTVMGGKNPFMGIAYVVVGGICIVLGALFILAHLIRPRKLGDHRYLTWNNEQPSTATATGRDSRFGG